MGSKRIVLATFLLLVSSSAFAETCGDADESGGVSLSDGVRVLRTAVGLALDCPTPLCDLDDSGHVTVSDGVSVLRTAAGLAVTRQCPVLSPRDHQVFSAYRKSTQVTSIVERGLDAASTADVALGATASCPDGGSTTQTESGVVYADCRAKSIVCSGPGVLTGIKFTASLQCTDLAETRSFDLAVDVTLSEAAGIRGINGHATGTQGSFPAFALDYHGLTLDADERGSRSAGAVDVGGPFFSSFFQRVEVSFPGSNPETGRADPGFAKIVGFSVPTGPFFVFDLDLRTGTLTAR